MVFPTSANFESILNVTQELSEFLDKVEIQPTSDKIEDLLLTKFILRNLTLKKNQLFLVKHVRSQLN